MDGWRGMERDVMGCDVMGWGTADCGFGFGFGEDLVLV